MKIRLLFLVLMLFILILFVSPLAAKDYELGTFASGVVQKVTVKVGDKVKRGQLLLMLDQKVFKAELKRAEKMLLSAQLNKTEAQKELDRAEELYERTVLSDHELNLAKVQYAAVDALAATAESELANAQYVLQYSQILSPAAGKIKKVNVWPGMIVNNRLKNTVLLVMTN